MAHVSTYQPKTAFTRWLDSRLPIIRFTADFMAFPTPRNLNYLWTFGAILTSSWGFKSSPASFWRCTTRRTRCSRSNSVEKLMRDINYGWLMRYTHVVGASMFFLAVYIHFLPRSLLRFLQGPA